MINLLPPLRKDQIRYARYNRIALRYLRVIITVVVILGLIFAATIAYLKITHDNVKHDVASKQAELKAAEPFKKQAAAVSDRLQAIKAVQGSQTRFSALLADLARVLPKGVAIDTLTLTGDDTKPLRLTVTGPSYSSLLALRDSLAASPRISGADLESITQDDNGSHGGLVVGFKKGLAK